MGRLVSLELSGNRTLRVGMVFVCPDDETLILSGAEAKIQVAERLKTRDVDDGILDLEMGLKVMPFAQVTVSTADGAAEASVYMTKDDLRRHVVEARAILRTMDAAAELADAEWVRYRSETRKRG